MKSYKDRSYNLLVKAVFCVGIGNLFIAQTKQKNHER